MRKAQVYSIKQLAGLITKYPQANSDCFVGIAGEEGSGKSVIARLLAKEQYPIMLNKPLDLVECMQFGRASLKDKLENTKSHIYIDDEAITNFSRTFYNKDQIEYIQMLKVIRFHNHIVYKNVPVLWELDSSIRRRLKVYIYIIRRVTKDRDGLAMVFKKENRPFVPDPWNQTENMKLDRKNMITKSPNFYGYLVIPNYMGVDWFEKMEVEAYKLKEEKKEAVYSDEDPKDMIKRFSPVLKAIIYRMLRDADILTSGASYKFAEAFDINSKTLTHYANIKLISLKSDIIKAVAKEFVMPEAKQKDNIINNDSN